MLSKLVLENFKSIGGRTELTLKPLTVLAGPNSSGKSSTLQSLLVLHQTLQSNAFHRPLILNGDFIKLGTLNDLVNHTARDKSVSIGFSLSHSIAELDPDGAWYIPYDRMNIEADLRFGGVITKRSELGSSISVVLQEALFRADIDGDEFPEIEVLRRNDEDYEALLQSHRDPANSRSLMYRVTGIPIEPRFSLAAVNHKPFFPGGGVIGATPVGVLLNHFLPTSVTFEIDANVEAFINALTDVFEYVENYGTLDHYVAGNPFEERAFAALREALEVLGPLDEVVSVLSSGLNIGWAQPGENLQRLTETVRLKLEQQIEGLNVRPGLQRVAVPDPLDSVFEALKHHFNSIRYLGPLRDEPKPAYDTTAAADSGDVGTRGEFTGSVLDLHQHDPIVYWDPNEKCVKNDTLLNAVTVWLRYFGVLHSVTAWDAGKLGHRLLVQPAITDRPLDLTNVGVGVSQVLPIVVMALVAKRGSTLLFEQPELHLHPKVQSRLGDFFLGLIETGKQVILETHSDCLVDRLRLRIAEEEETAETPPLYETIAIYFVDRPDGQTRFRRVAVNEYGAIPEWPEGFFDDGPREADLIIEAAMRKRRLKRGRAQ